MAGQLVDTAQALLQATDTALSRAWRDEDRGWRKADLAWREEERAFRQEQEAWRRQDLVQRHVENARALWARHVEKNRRDVEERAEQLKAISNLSALVAGFALVSFLQFDFDQQDSSEGVQLAFGLTIAATVLLEGNAMVICALIHASILKTGRSYVSSAEEAEFMQRARAFAATYQPGDRPPAPRRNFQAHWQYACEGAWTTAFLMFSAGVPIYFVNMALAAWIKFHYSVTIASCMTALMAAAVAYFLVAQNRWSWHLIGRRSWESDLLEEAVPQAPPGGLSWDWHGRPLDRVPPTIAVVGGGGRAVSGAAWRNGAAAGLEKRSSEPAAAGMQQQEAEQPEAEQQACADAAADVER